MGLPKHAVFFAQSKSPSFIANNREYGRKKETNGNLFGVKSCQWGGLRVLPCFF